MLCNTGVKFASLIVLLGACATGASTEPQLTEQAPAVIPTAPANPAPAIVPTRVFSIPPFESSGHAELDAWRTDFAQRAMEAGRNPMIVYDVLADAKPLEAYL